MKFFQLLYLILLLKTSTVFDKSTNIDNIAAMINDHIILHSDVLNKINLIKHDKYLFSQDSLQYQDLYYKTLNQLITNHLINQIAIKKDIKIHDDHIHQLIDYTIHARNVSKKQFLKYLNDYELNYQQYYKEIYQELINKILYHDIIFKNIHPSLLEINNVVQKLNNIDFNKHFKLIHFFIELPIQESSLQIDTFNNLEKMLLTIIQSTHDIHKLLHIYYNNNIFPRMTIQEMQCIPWMYVPIIFDQYLNLSKPGDIIGPIRSYNGLHILKIQNIYNKNYRFPVIKVKIRNIFSKNTSDNIHIANQLLKIKKTLENNSSAVNIVIQENSNNFYCIENYGYPSEWIDINHLDLVIQQSLKSLKKNQISMPIYTSNGWCIMQLIDINKLNYSDVIQERAYLHVLYQKFNETLDEWIKKLKSQSYIKIINQYDQ